MRQVHTLSPELIPVLSAGKHRNPRRGACFMEFASFLAGERWSDHPACTHPALASLARCVNDSSSDRERGRLAELIPSVIGLRGDDPRADLVLAVLAGTSALPIASEERQRVIATGLIHAEMLLTDDEQSRRLRRMIDDAFLLAPGATRWARGFMATMGDGSHPFEPWAVERFIAISVIGIAQACVDDSDARLRVLLTTAIDECAVLFAAAPASRKWGREFANA